MTTLAKEIPTKYDPTAVEGKWYQYWLEKRFFHAEVEKDKEPFSIVIPPPNVTGSLHLGHAWDNTLQDIFIRWRRMQGKNTVWIPGTDHAGIATQIKVEQALAKEGLTRYDLGREKFLERVWQWKEKYGSTIINQLKRLGASCDWDRTRFTLDPGLSRAVREVFVRLYEKGLIYRGARIVNWCPNCRTTVSDLEVQHEETKGHLYHIRYPYADGTGHVIVATTRPETMLGDTAVAVNPSDDRYKGVVGKEVILPVVGRRIPIIADEHADPEFGTGAVKVTPAHDPNDFEIGLRHNLEPIVVIDDRGRMNANAGKFEGLDRYECRRQLVKELEEGGYLVKVEDHVHAVGHHDRCDTVIEPVISRQWFVKMEPLAKAAIDAVRLGKIRIIPERFEKVYFHWMENVQDWCISRQLWWGHRIPVWYCQRCGETIVAREDPSACSKCGSAELEQDPDVLDTWFSSALWPFSTMGWPEKTPELEHFYPTSVLVTGYDILFFWVARMITMGMEFMGKEPFKTVFLHGLIRDAEGKKMSKSRGNSVDPLDIIEEYGADTLRFTMVTGNTPGNDLKFSMERVEASRNFANKIWNASRFVLMNLEGFDPSAVDRSALEFTTADRWIVSRVNWVTGEVTRLLERFDVGEAAKTLYDFIWSEYCDWYIEIVKPRLYSKGDPQGRLTAQYVLWSVLERTLRLLHPFMPFITEEIWQAIPHEGESLMVQRWPEYEEALADARAEGQMALVMEAVRAVRNVRAELAVPPSRRIAAVVVAEGDAYEVLNANSGIFGHLAGIGDLTLTQDPKAKPERSMSAIVAGATIYVPLAGLIDVDREIERLEKELSSLEAELAKLDAKLANEKFVTKAPAEVVERERGRRDEMKDKADKVRARLAELRG